MSEQQQQLEELVVLEEKCDIQGHENYDLVAVCLDEDCTSEKRLACSKCLVFNHGEHTNACLFLEDLKDPKKLALKAWSKDNLGKQVEQYLKENENIEQEIDTMMDKLMEDIIDETNKAKNVMRRKRIEGKTEVQKTAKKIQAKYEAAYDIKHIRSILVDFMDDKMKEEDLNDKLEEIIKAREEIEDLNRKNKLVASYPVIDKEFLQEKQDSLLEIISQLSNTIRIPNAWVLMKAKVGNNQMVKEITPGKSFEFNEQQTHQIVYGSETMKEGVHTWVIRIEMAKKNKEEDDDEEDNEEEKNNENEPAANEPPANNFGQPGGFGGGFGQGGFGQPPVANAVNFNHPDYQVLRNLYIGIINEKKKDNQQSYVRGVGGQAQDSHALDVIRNQLLGGYLFFSGQAQKQMSQLFWEKRETTGIELHITLDLDQSKLYIKDKDQETSYEANFQGMFKGMTWRPYICSARSRCKVTLVSSLNN